MCTDHTWSFTPTISGEHCARPQYSRIVARYQSSAFVIQTREVGPSSLTVYGSCCISLNGPERERSGDRVQCVGHGNSPGACPLI